MPEPRPRLILASRSAARLSLLRAAGLEPDIISTEIDEPALRMAARAAGRDVGEAALAIAEAKARALGPLDRDAVVVAADQILECDGDWLGKPASLEDARAQLLGLAGKTHRLVSVVVAARYGAVTWRAVDSAELTMRPFSDSFLDSYLAAAGEEVLSTVGCYRLEGSGVQLFEQVSGDFFTILGLPLLPLLAYLRDVGMLAQ